MPRLRRSRLDDPGIGRRRRGTGFSYTLPDGSVLRDLDELARIRALAVPPAWREVWIAPRADDHIQAVGTDDAGRRQYRYHEQWRRTRDRAKFERMLELAAVLPGARRRVTTDIRADGLGRDRVLAGAFRLLDLGGLRIGDRKAADERGTIGLTTLTGRHARVRGDEIMLEFPGKSGQPWASQVRDAELADLLRDLRRGRLDSPLFAWSASPGERRPLRADEINADIGARTGQAFTAKDFRTLRGTAAAAQALALTGPAPTAAARRRAVVAAMVAAAGELGNTPAVARGSYVDPKIVDRYDRGETIAVDRRAVETRLREMLSH